MGDYPNTRVTGYARTNEECCRLLANLGVEINNHSSVYQAVPEMIAGGDFDCVVNCIGITKHDRASSDLEALYGANLALPIFLAKLCENRSTLFVQISTDCVFSGHQGGYTDHCAPDATDDYGLSKALAESSLKRDSVVIRTSTVGFHPYRREGLFDWFVTNESDHCYGFTNAIYSGLTTTFFAADLFNFMATNTLDRGLVNMAGPRINKYELLKILNIEGGFNKTILQRQDPVIDRSLERSVSLTTFEGVGWTEMIKRELKENGYI